MKTNKGNKVFLDPDAEYMIAPWTIDERESHSGRVTLKVSRMHLGRLIMGAMPGEEVDHINHNQYDNRRCNLRICTPTENCRNKRVYVNNRLGVKGVRFDSRTKKYVARICINKRLVHIGSFNSLSAAQEARQLRARVEFGDFCNE